jgi:hypothetical protein
MTSSTTTACPVPPERPPERVWIDGGAPVVFADICARLGDVIDRNGLAAGDVIGLNLTMPAGGTAARHAVSSYLSGVPTRDSARCVVQVLARPASRSTEGTPSAW